MKIFSVFLAGTSALALLAYPAQAQIRTTVTTTYNYDFPDQGATATSQTSTTQTTRSCYSSIGGGGGGGGGRGDHPGSYADTDGDGVSDRSVNSTVGSMDGYGGRTQSSSGQSTGGGRGCVLCTHFYRKGLIPKHVFAADMQYGLENVSETTLRGYHTWGVPLVALLQIGDHPWLERFLFRAVSGWAHQMAYAKGAWHKPNLIGWTMTKTVEPLCTLIGLFTTPKDYRQLWV
ncbi:MAG: hypothetical protein ACTHKQ_25705 [Mesorhizobium sp.]